MKVKRLYTIGDSWTYGDELPNPKEQSYPALLAQKFNCELINKGAPGGPNDWMFRKTIEWVSCQENLDDIVLIVAWSEPNRREEDYNFINLHDIERVKYFYNNELAHYQSLCYMVTLQEFLKSKNIKYLFFLPWYDILRCEKDLIRSRKERKKFNEWLKDNYRKECYSENLEIEKIIENIDKKYIILPLTKSRPLKSGKGGHPSKEEHKIMAKFIKEKLVELYK